MNLRIFLSKKFAIFFILSALLFSVVLRYQDSRDVYLLQAKTGLITNPEIQKKFGNIISTEVTKRLFVDAMMNHDPYNEYIFFINGEKNKGLVTVKVIKNTDSRLTPTYQILSMKNTRIVYMAEQ